MSIGKNLSIKQPHPSKTCTMYYLQHKRLQQTCNASSFKTQKTNPIVTYHTNNTLSLSSICNLKNSYIMQFPFRETSKEQLYQGFTILQKNRNPIFFIVVNDQLPHVFMSSPIIKSSRDSSYASQESVIIVSIMISLHTIQDANIFKWSDTSTCQLDMYSHT